MNIFNNKNGFTLMEIMVVVILIGILAAAGIPYYKGHVERQKAATGATTLRMISDSLERYMAMRGDSMPSGLKLSLLDADIDKSKLNSTKTEYNDGVFTYFLSGNSENPSVIAKRNTGDYTLSFNLSDASYGLNCTPSDFCCEKLSMFCEDEE